MFTIDPDITRATTPPPRIYTDPAVLDAERASVFARTWQLVGRVEQLSEHGAQLVAELAGHSVVIVRDGEQLRGFYNLCRHRAGPVATACQVRKTLQCRYHGWTYDLTGQLRRAPEMDGAADFDAAAFALAPIAVDQWGPLVFAALEPRCSLAEQLPPPPATPLVYVMRRDYEVDCNWKVYVDNYLEGYHIPIVHPELHRELDYDAYRTETHRYYSRQYAPLRPVSGAGERRYDPARQPGDSEYYWAFPNLMLNIYQGQLQTNLVVPLGHTRARVEFEWYAETDRAGDERWQQLIDFSDLVQEQDAQICAQVQRNLSAPACRPGRYSPRRENGVHHFHRLLAELLDEME